MNNASEFDEFTGALLTVEATTSRQMKTLMSYLVAVTIAIIAGIQAMALVLSAPSPLVPQLWQDPSAILQNVLKSDAVGKPTAPKSRERDARAALEASPLNAMGLAQLGYSWKQQGRSARSIFSIMQMADRLSSSEPLAKSWLIDYYLRSNKIDEALYHIDILLRAHPGLGRPLLDGLAQIIGYGEAQPPVARLINARPIWTDAFLDVALSGSKPALPVGQLLLLVDQNIATSLRTEFKIRLLRGLTDDRDFDVLLALYPHLVGKNQGSNPWAFDNVAGLPPAAWLGNGDVGYGGSIEHNRSGNGLLIQGWVMPGARSVVMQKLFLLPDRAGEWQIVSRRLSSSKEPQASANWRVTCASPGDPQPSRESGNLLFGPAFTTLPLDGMECRRFFVELVMSGGEATQEVELNLADVSLVPSGARSTLPVLPIEEDAIP